MREIRVAEAVFLIVAVIECRLQLAFRGGQVILDTYCTSVGGSDASRQGAHQRAEPRAVAVGVIRGTPQLYAKCGE